MTMTADERAEQLVLAYFEDYDGGDAEAELRELAQRAFRAAEQVAEQRGAEREREACAALAHGYWMTGMNARSQKSAEACASSIRTAILARAKQQESTDV